MIAYRTKLTTAIITASLLAGSFAPLVYADTTITIDSNGAGSNNSVNVTNNLTTNVTQSNGMDVYVVVDSKAKTGGNEASNNTGGNVTIDTGNATSNVTVDISGGSNVANIPCACNATNDTVNVSNNGADSNNTSHITNKKKKIVNQTNSGGITGVVGSRAKTGRNRANNNTNGTTNVSTGNANSTVNATVTGPSNEVNLTP